MLLGGDPLGLLDDDPRFQRLLQLLAGLLLLARLGGVDHVAGRRVGQYPGDRDVLTRPVARLGEQRFKAPMIWSSSRIGIPATPAMERRVAEAENSG